MKRCAHEQPFVNNVGMGPVRDLRTTTVPKLPGLALFHPEMQEVMLEAARDAGAEVWRGASVRGLSLNQCPEVAVERDGQAVIPTARLVVCADGRTSNGRTWGGFATVRARQKLLGAGVLFENMNVDPKVTLRVLPVHALIKDFTVPRCAFTIYTYPDPGDPDVVAIDTVTSDLILTEPDQVTPYDRLYERLRDAALPPADSLDLLTKAAAELPDQ